MHVSPALNSLNGARLGFFVVAILWGTSFAFQKMLLESVSASQLVFWNFFPTGIFFLALALYRRQSLLYRWREGVLLGVCLSALEIFQMLGLHVSTAGNTVFITNMGMLLIPYLGYLLYRHNIGFYNNLALCLSIVGLYLLVGGLRGIGVGELLLLVAVFAMAFYFLFSQTFEGECSSHVTTLCAQQFLTVALLCGAVVLVTGQSFALPSTLIANFSAQVIVFTIIPFGIIQWASRYSTEMTAAVFDGVVEPLVGGIVAWGLFREPATPTMIAGGLLMVVAFGLANIFMNKRSFSWLLRSRSRL